MTKKHPIKYIRSIMIILLTLLFCIPLFCLPVYASDGLTGDWGGARGDMEESGIALEVVYTGDSIKNFSGGAAQGSTYHGNIDIAFELDTEAVGMWDGGTLFVYGISDHGGNATGSMIGDLQGVSNIEAPSQTIIHEAWYQQNFFNDGLSLLGGLYDLNAEFDVSEFGSLFLNGSFGIGPDISANVPASLYPKAGAGLRIKVQAFDSWYLQLAGFDGDPSTRTAKKQEGYMYAAETGVVWDDGFTGGYKLGYWLHTGDKLGADGVSMYGSDSGIYFVADQMLAPFDAGGGVAFFLQLGSTPADRNDVSSYIGAGLHIQGLFSARVDDEIGIAMARANISDKAQLANGWATHETVWELTYRAVITPWLAIQPSYQYIINVGADPLLSNAGVGLLRFEIAL
ncbi:MAG: carbohydrate porin [Mariprofundales bacterium]